MVPRTALFASPAGLPKLLMVFLRGAYDSSSVLVPRGNSFYQESRPTLAIPSSGTGAAAMLDGDWGLAPVLVPNLMPFWRAGEMAFLPFAGNNNLSRSHFETQDFFEIGMPSVRPGGPSPTGFMNRLAGVLQGRKVDVRPLAFTAQLPLTFRGPVPIVNNVPKASARTSPAQSRRDAMLARMYAGDAELGARVSAGFAVGADVSAALADEMKRSGKGAMGANDFEGAAQRVGAVMRSEVNLGFIDVGGWDTHVQQSGALNFRLGVLARGLAGFARVMGPAWQQTLVIVVSEFGRTFRENGAGGTDHGHGTSFWLLGGAVKSAQIAGAQVKISRATLNQDRDFPVLNDYRSSLGGIFQRLYGLDAAALAKVFPGSRPLDLGLV
jgi:uncharacterized protein (DUF1501 family)